MPSSTSNSKADAPVEGDFGPGRDQLLPGSPAEDVQRLQEALGQEHDRYIRLLADFTNYRRRAEGDGNRLAQAGKREVILPLLSVVDDLERGLTHTSGMRFPISDGLRIVYQKLLALLQAEGVHSFASVGEKFTPNLHEAVAVSGREGAEPGTIVEDLRHGYVWGNELLRPAQVCVAP